MVGDKWLRRQYVKYNKEFFHDTLPSDLIVRFADGGGKWEGQTLFDNEKKVAVEVLIEKRLRDFADYSCIVLLHELAHVSVGFKERHLHGPLWKKERKRLIDAGAFTPLL